MFNCLSADNQRSPENLVNSDVGRIGAIPLAMLILGSVFECAMRLGIILFPIPSFFGDLMIGRMPSPTASLPSATEAHFAGFAAGLSLYAIMAVWALSNDCRHVHSALQPAASRG